MRAERDREGGVAVVGGGAGSREVAEGGGEGVDRGGGVEQEGGHEKYKPVPQTPHRGADE